MEGNMVIVYLACVIAFIMIGRIFYVPLKHIMKLILNSLLGGLAIYIVNIIGASFNFHIGLNWGTIIFAGVLGLPRCNCISCYKSFIIK